MRGSIMGFAEFSISLSHSLLQRRQRHRMVIGPVSSRGIPSESVWRLLLFPPRDRSIHSANRCSLLLTGNPQKMQLRVDIRNPLPHRSDDVELRSPIYAIKGKAELAPKSSRMVAHRECLRRRSSIVLLSAGVLRTGSHPHRRNGTGGIDKGSKIGQGRLIFKRTCLGEEFSI